MYNAKYLLLSHVAIFSSFISGYCNADNKLYTKQEYVLNHVPIKEGKRIKLITLNQAMTKFKVPALSVAVIQNNTIIWAKAVGYTDSNRTTKINLKTLFQAGSLSKSVTAMVVLNLVDKGVLNLDNPINQLLQDWSIPQPNDPVTVRELLSMTSGLNVGGYYGYEASEILPSLIETLAGKKPANNAPIQMIDKPGKKYFYSGGGYEVLQLLIQSQTATLFPNIVQNIVLCPLAMNNSYYFQPLPTKLTTNVALATNNKGATFSYKYRVMPEYAAAGLWSTPTDLSKFVISIMDAYQGKPSVILKQKTTKLALTQQQNTPYGLGFVVDGIGKKLHFMKLGQNAGYQGWLVGFPNTGQGVVVMTNSDNGIELAQDLIYAIARAYQWPTNGELKDAWMVK